MKVEIWSDVMCPFCYIGKHHYEEALASFEEGKRIETVWKSFQLDPSIPKNTPGTDTYTYLSERKGLSPEQAREMSDNLAHRAAEEGLQMNFEKVVVANTFDAHRLIHLAQESGMGSEMEEKLFEAHFVSGKDVSDRAVLAELGQSLGLKGEDVADMFESGRLSEEVKSDVKEGAQLGLTGVPFFVFNRKYAVSGAQPVERFVQALSKAYSEWEAQNPPVVLTRVGDGPSCSPESGCA